MLRYILRGTRSVQTFITKYAKTSTWHEINGFLFFSSQQLLSVVKTLQIKLADEAMKNAMMELKIREEVSQEMSEQMAEIENNYRLVVVSIFSVVKAISFKTLSS